MIVKQAFDFHSALTDAVRFEPVKLSLGDRTILESYGREPLQFAPVPTAVQTNERR
jgi:hypothetical protein